MNQTAWRCLAAFWIAALAATAPLGVAAQETGPSAGSQTHTPTPTAKPADNLPDRKMGKRETYPFRGVVGSIDPATRQITLQGKNSHRVIAVIGETQVTRDGAPATLQDVKAGERLGGTLRKTGDGREEALLIHIDPKPDPTKPGGKSKGRAKAKATGHTSPADSGP